MQDLFFSEIRRFRNAALIFAAIHLLVQLLVNRLVDFPQMRWQPHLLVLSIYALAGFGFALYQFGTYRQPSRWVWLLHRPLARHRIYLAVAGASLALIAFAVGLPVLLMLLANDTLTGRVVDLRHYMMALQLVLMTGMAWLAGTYMILNRSRLAIVIVLLPFLLLAHQAPVYVMLPAALLCLALLFYIASCSFKPDRLAPPDSGPMLLAIGAPLQLGFYFALLWGGSLLYQYGQIFAGVHPNNLDVPPAGGYVEALRADGGDLFRLGLAASADPRAASWSRQMPLLKPERIPVWFKQFSVRHQQGNHASSDTLADDGTIWTFSHDDMRLHGRDARTGKPRGTLAPAGARSFRAPVLLLPEGYAVARQDIYRLDPHGGGLRRLVSLDGGEQLVSLPQRVGAQRYLVTNARVIVFDADDGGAGPLRARYSVPLPGPLNNLARVDAVELYDATLLSFLFGQNRLDGEPDVPHTILRIERDGLATVVARRALGHDFPLLFEHKDWWLSPALHGVLALPDILFDKGLVLDRGKRIYDNPLLRPRPPQAWAAAVLCALLAAAGAAWRLRGAAVPARRRTGWIAACLLLGLPSLLTLAVLQPRALRSPTAAAPSAAVPA